MSAVALNTETEDSREVPRERPSWWTLPRKIWVGVWVFIMAAVVLLVKTWQWLDQPVTQVQVFGEVKYFDAQKAVTDWLPANAKLLSVDLQALHAFVQSEPWVAQVSLIKNWPNTLELHVTEEKAIAHWGEDGLLNAQAKVFWPEVSTSDQGLPQFNGPEGSEKQLVAQYHDLNSLLRTKSLALKSLTLEPRGSWKFELTNGVLVTLGMEDINERLVRFLSLYERVLHAKIEQVASVDLRYTNGVAVAWKQIPSETEQR